MKQSEQLKLRLLRNEDKSSFVEAILEFKRLDPKSNEIFAFQYDPKMPFEDYVDMVNAWPEGKRLPKTFVPNTFYVGVVKEKIVGRLSFRHHLNDFLERIGGHVGYCVIPSERRKGYASEMLSQVKAIAQSQGLSRLLVTCDTDNIPSIRVIEKNGGIYENTSNEPELTVQKHRYWVGLQQ